MIETIYDSFLTELDLFLGFLPRLFIALAVYLIIYFAGKFAGRGLLRILQHSSMPDTYFPFFRKLVSGIFIFGGFIVFLNMLGYTALAASLLAGGGFTAVILGFAFKDIGENLLAGFFLVFSRPFNQNDLIESGGIMGRVQNIELRHTHIRTGDGCDVFIPSVQLFTKPLHNYTLDGLRRGSFSIAISYTDDAAEAIRIMLESLRGVNGVLKKPASTIQISKFDPNFIEFQLSFWINANNQELSLPKIRTNAMNECLLALQKASFTLSSDVSTNVDLSPVRVNLDNSATATS